MNFFVFHGGTSFGFCGPGGNLSAVGTYEPQAGGGGGGGNGWGRRPASPLWGSIHILPSGHRVPPHTFWIVLNAPTKKPIFKLQVQSLNQSNTKKHILSYPSSFLTPSQHHPYTRSITTIRTTYHLNKSHPEIPSKISIMSSLFQLDTLTHFQQIRTV